ncbi:hypothetical protein WJX73_000293 [Symbiochloris irregularis]|uniref:Uncharacterized protein n=1 Tax=Symbiochloris irregularis TaxID=706552 RepID=A0AAW1NW57_9CHLO
MTPQRQQRNSIFRKQISTLIKLLAIVVFGFSTVLWLVLRQHSPTDGDFGQASFQADQANRKHRLALGLTMKGGLNAEQHKHFDELVRDLPAIDHDGKQLSQSKLTKLLSEQSNLGHLDPQHLTQTQEQLVNAALARQARYSIDRLTEIKMKRGIVIAAGGALQLASAYATLKTLREHHKCTLPVQLWFNGEGEMDNSTQAFFEDRFANLTCIDGSTFTVPSHHRAMTPIDHAGWTFKAFALYSTSFRHVLYLDADSLPLVSPEYLFDTLGFRQYGSLFWPDYWDTTWMNPAPAYRLMNASSPWLGRPNLLTTESGEFLLDRDRHIDALEWMLYLNMYGDIFYSVVWGDKDLYRLAFTLAGQGDSFYQVSHRPADALLLCRIRRVLQYKGGKQSPEMTYQHAAMVQLDPGGSMAFFHRTSDAKLNPDKVYPPNQQAADFITVPLAPHRATAVLSGALIFGPAGLSVMKTANCTVPGAQQTILQRTAACELNPNQDDMPIPVWPLSVFPLAEATLRHSFQAFLEVQAWYNSSELPLNG